MCIVSTTANYKERNFTVFDNENPFYNKLHFYKNN